MRDKGHNFLRVYAIMEAVVGSDWPISSAELSERVDLPKPTVYRLCQLLENEHLLTREIDGKRFIPGPRLKSLALKILGTQTVALERYAILQRLSDEVGETCNLTVPDGTHMLYLDRVETNWPLRIALPVGSHVPLHCTASGKLYLSHLPARERRRVLTKLKLDRYTDNTITDIKKLEAALKQIRFNKIGVDDEEFYDGMVAVSVPIKDPRGRICATLAVHGPTQRFDLQKAKAYIPAMRQAAEGISQVMI